MKARRRGAIVQISSIVAHQGALRGHIAYATAKAGLLGFTKTLARDVGPHGIRVNAIAPGIVDTQMLHDAHGAAGIAELKRAVPLGTLAAPEDIAAAALFLCSPAAAHITGATLDVTGGMVMR
jgi:3-oxoacyl-[acyl-carrier protein] reductase